MDVYLFYCTANVCATVGDDSYIAGVDICMDFVEVFVLDVYYCYYSYFLKLLSFPFFQNIFIAVALIRIVRCAQDF